MSSNCMIATPRIEEITDFLGGLRESGTVEVTVIGTGEDALSAIKNEAPSFVVVDEGLSDYAPLDLVMEIIKANALINTTVVSSLSPREFHDASEGLGVLTSLPPQPSREDGIELALTFARFI